MGPRDHIPVEPRRRALLEAALPVLAFQAWVWLSPYPRPRAGDAVIGVALLLFIGWRLRRTGPVGWRAFGLARGTHRASLAPVLVPSALIGGGALGVGALTDRLTLDHDLLRALLTYPPRAALQQALVFGYLHPRACRVLGDQRAALLTATLFGLAHAPNPLLMAGGAVMVLIFAPVWRRTPSLPVQSLGHGLMGAIAHKGLDVSMRVGRGYLA